MPGVLLSLQMVRLHAPEALLKVMLEEKITQSSLSCFLTKATPGRNSTGAGCFAESQEPDPALQGGVALDDSLVLHPYAKKIPLAFRSLPSGVHLWASNLVAWSSRAGWRCRCCVEFRSSPKGKSCPSCNGCRRQAFSNCEVDWPDRAEMKWFKSNSKWKQLP